MSQTPSTPTAREELTAAADALAAVLNAATPLPWVRGRWGGAVVAPHFPSADPETARYYGGELIGESMRSADQAAVVVLARIGPALLALLRALADDCTPTELLDDSDTDDGVLRAFLLAITAPVAPPLPDPMPALPAGPTTGGTSR